jgi:hypothetical protein
MSELRRRAELSLAALRVQAPLTWVALRHWVAVPRARAASRRQVRLAVVARALLVSLVVGGLLVAFLFSAYLFVSGVLGVLAVLAAALAALAAALLDLAGKILLGLIVLAVVVLLGQALIAASRAEPAPPARPAPARAPRADPPTAPTPSVAKASALGAGAAQLEQLFHEFLWSGPANPPRLTGGALRCPECGADGAINAPGLGRCARGHTWKL